MDASQFIKFNQPFTCLIAGATRSGKSTLVKNILSNCETLFNKDSLRVMYCHGMLTNKDPETIPDVHLQYYTTLPNEKEIDDFAPDIIVIDDLMVELSKSPQLLNMFTKGSHHKNINVFFLTQNLFFNSPIWRTLSLNAHYLFIMKNPRDRSQINHIARQFYPRQPNILTEAYEDATREPFSYLKIDATPETPDDYRIQSRITSEDNKGTLSPIFYIPKKHVRKP